MVMFKVPGTSSASADAEVHNEAAVAGSDTNLPAEDTARAPAYLLPEQGPLDAQGSRRQQAFARLPPSGLVRLPGTHAPDQGPALVVQPLLVSPTPISPCVEGPILSQRLAVAPPRPTVPTTPSPVKRANSAIKRGFAALLEGRRGATEGGMLQATRDRYRFESEEESSRRFIPSNALSARSRSDYGSAPERNMYTHIGENTLPSTNDGVSTEVGEDLNHEHSDVSQ